MVSLRLVALTAVAVILSPGLTSAQTADGRLEQVRTLRDSYHPWTPADSLEEWERQREDTRHQVLVATGLWPLPQRTPLNARISGPVPRGEYTVEKVAFESLPGHYVTGNLYRPTGLAADAKVPGVLCPHGHWQNGRFYDAGAEKAADQLEKGAEDHLSGARFPVQARMAHLAKLGCIVFHYDMVGYADSDAIDHRSGFNDAQAALWLHNKLGLQTWNSIRALDFLTELPDVDADRIAVTGASGGGTQTFLLAAVDDRPDVFFPAVMVSTGMQGGCVCENASYLRLGINNIAIAALAAPRPMAMSGADDWTVDLMTRGFPELKHVYSLYGKDDLVDAQVFPEFKHNYNQHARELMYDWLITHLNLDVPEHFVEQSDFWPLTQNEMSVWTDEHPRPEHVKSAEQLRDDLRERDRRQFQALLDDPEQRDRVLDVAIRVMLDPHPPEVADVEILSQEETAVGTREVICRRAGSEERIPMTVWDPGAAPGATVLWIDEGGRSSLAGDADQPAVAAQKLVDAGWRVATADVYGTGTLDAGSFTVDETYVGYTFGYNRPLLSERVRDVLTCIATLQKLAADPQHPVRLVGTGDAGPWVLLASSLAPANGGVTVADLAGFTFASIDSTGHPMLLPGALKYGGIGGLAIPASERRLHLFGATEAVEAELEPLRRAAPADNVQIDRDRLNEDELTRLLSVPQ